MIGPSSRKTVSLLLLALISAYAIAQELGASASLARWVLVAQIAWVALEFRNLAGISKLTFAVIASMSLVFYFHGGISEELLWKAIERSAFFTLFLLSLDTLRTAANSSRLVQKTGHLIVNQPPGRRYAMLSLGGHLFAVLLNVGSINLLGTMVARSVRKPKQGYDAVVQAIRLKRMTLALVRAFAAFTMWAPSSVTVFAVITAIPDFDWVEFAPMGASIAAVVLCFGWLLDRLTYPKSKLSNLQETQGDLLRSFTSLVLLISTLLATTLLFGSVADTGLIGSLLICIPFFSTIWMMVQFKRKGPKRAALLGIRRVVRQVIPGFLSLRSEVVILSSAGFIAVVLPHQIDTEALGQMIASQNLSEAWLLVMMMWIVFLTAPIGLNPMISTLVCLEILIQLPNFTFTPYALSMGAVVAWGLATGMSPFGATIRLSGRTVSHAPSRIGLAWNGPFSIIVLVAASAVQLILN
ncbi:hypothetical protein [Ruegeria sp. SCP11]|uniref:hypothetical protein n=1 Tax=Ruegeria sp. SCP11 TaxID=3141378 RepID=UPI0033364004